MPVTPRTFAILQAIQYEMQRDPKIVCSLQGSIGSATRPDGKSINFLSEFGLDRAMGRFGQAIDEIWMAGSTVFYPFIEGHCAITQLPGMTTMYPAELMFNAAGPYRYQTGGMIPSVSCVIWLAAPGRGAGSGAEHSTAGVESVYAYYSGIKVVCPHKVYDAKGLMAAAIRDGNPVMYVAYSSEASADIPDEAYVVPIGKANILKEGTDITIAANPPASLEVETAIATLEKDGIKAEFFDVRTLKPFDEATLVKSVKKTGRLLAVSYGNYTNDFTSHILAVAAQEVPGLKCRKITFPDVPSPASREMINWMKPDNPKIVDAAKKLAKL